VYRRMSAPLTSGVIRTLSGTGGTFHARYSQTTDEALVWEEVAVTQTGSGSVMSTRIPDRPARSNISKTARF